MWRRRFGPDIGDGFACRRGSPKSRRVGRRSRLRRRNGEELRGHRCDHVGGRAVVLTLQHGVLAVRQERCDPGVGVPKEIRARPAGHHEGRNADRSDEVVRDRATPADVTHDLEVIGHRRATACIFGSLLIPSTISGGIPVAAKNSLIASARRSLARADAVCSSDPALRRHPRRSIVVCPARAALATAGQAGRAVQRDGRSSRHQRPRRRCCRRPTVALEMAATRAVPTITARADVRAP